MATIPVTRRHTRRHTPPAPVFPPKKPVEKTDIPELRPPAPARQDQQPANGRKPNAYIPIPKKEADRTFMGTLPGETTQNQQPVNRQTPVPSKSADQLFMGTIPSEAPQQNSPQTQQRIPDYYR